MALSPMACMQVRLKLLLSHLRKGRWRKLPAQVGLKTALVAEELGLIEARGEDLRARSYRLTVNGSTYLTGTVPVGE
jgi:crotonobetainyl-CoA:carnitine CoA-transferase CaiB-like acyl-CoA transferase